MDFSWDAECYDMHVSAYTAIKNLWSRALYICTYVMCIRIEHITNKELNTKTPKYSCTKKKKKVIKS